MTSACSTSRRGTRALTDTPLNNTPLDPWEIGRRHEQSASPAERSARGAFYTPRGVAEAVASLAFDAAEGLPNRVMDPTCGGGAFLIAALDQFVARGVSPADAIGRVAGRDIDAGAVRATRSAVETWAAQHGVPSVPHLDVAQGDALASSTAAGSTAADVIVGNPPFATPLKGAGLPTAAHDYRLAHRDLLGPYADLAAVHLLHAVRSGAQVVAFVLPQSLLSSRDTAGLRFRLEIEAPTAAVWASADLEFDASVRVFAPVLRVGGHSEPSIASAPPSWAEQVAGELGVPASPLPLEGGTLGDLATATAGFRDEYYALAEACGEQDELGASFPRVATVGAIDPLVFHWGERPTRFAKRVWTRPVVDEARIPAEKQEWFARQRRPKVLLPTQSKVFEPFVDRDGSVLPVTPLISVHADAADLDLVAAVLLAPPVVAWAHRRWFGSALAASGIKLAAKDVLTLPLPSDVALWREAAALVPEGPAALAEIGRLMTRAYDADDALLEFWLERLPASPEAR